MTVFQILMLPANKVCDSFGMVDENERGVVRMLINALIWATIGVLVVWVILA